MSTPPRDNLPPSDRRACGDPLRGAGDGDAPRVGHDPVSADPAAEPPLVSIVTPSLNQARFLDATVRSVLGQDYPRIEYVVMDGGSSDGTAALMERYRDRLEFVAEPDEGQSDAINRGITRCRGSIVGWLNADDLYRPDTVSTIVAEFTEHPDVALVYGDAVFVDAEGGEIAPAKHVRSFDPRQLLQHSDFIVQPAAFFRREAFDAVGGLRTDLHWTLDYDLWIRLARRFPARYVPRLLAHVRCYAETKTAAGGWGRIAEVQRMLADHGVRRLPSLFRIEAAALHWRDALEAIRQRRPVAALVSSLGAVGRVLSAAPSLLEPSTWRVIRAWRLRGRHIARHP